MFRRGSRVAAGRRRGATRLPRDCHAIATARKCCNRVATGEAQREARVWHPGEIKGQNRPLFRDDPSHSSATWHDLAGDQQTRRGAAPARPRAAARRLTDAPTEGHRPSLRPSHRRSRPVSGGSRLLEGRRSPCRLWNRDSVASRDHFSKRPTRSQPATTSENPDERRDKRRRKTA